MSLTFTPKILYYANLYFFIQNLSEWHFSNRKDYNAKIKNVCATFESYFNTVYAKDEIMLKKWEAIIAKPEFVTNASYINNTLANFYGCAPYNENCTIYLLLSTRKRNGGTAGTISNNAVTLELSR